MRGWGDIAERLRRGTVTVRSASGRGAGSGIVWDASGLILTNAHVIQARDLEVEFAGGRRVPARIAARDPRRDLASLRAPAEGLEPLAAGDSAALRPGELVLAVGNPLGFTGALSTGSVHSLANGWIRSAIQLAPGNSGGPLANARGEVVGVNTAIHGGLGLAIPVNDARDFLARRPRPQLGVTLRPVPLGLLLLEVEPEGAAARANLRAGDLLLIRWDALDAALAAGRETLRLHFLRDGSRRVRETVVSLRAPVEVAA